MGIFSELNLEQQYPESTGAEASADAIPVKSPAPQAAAPFSSPFIGSGFPLSPFMSTAPSQPATETGAAAQPVTLGGNAAEQQSPSPADAKEKSPQSAQNFAENEQSDDTAEDNTANKADENEDAKRKAHEEAEAKRKAEWEAKFAERRAKEQAERDRVAALSDDAVMSEAMKRVADGFERLTRRNMKDMVSEYVQTACLSDPVFARNAMSPKKSMINCVKYINNKAVEFIKQEMKDNDMKPINGMYGGDVPDDVVYQWAVDYFNDPNAKEDEPEDEKFVPKPYYGGTSSSKSKKKDKEKEKAKKEAEKKAAAKKAAEEKAKKKADDGQISLLGDAA